MLIILEGNEATFKSTIAAKLGYILGTQVRHGSSFELAKMPQDQLFDHYLNLASSSHDVIYDRFIYSNRVYASLYQGVSLLSMEQIRMVETLIQVYHKQILVVHCSAYEWDIEERIKNRGEEVIKTDMLVPISQRYHRVMTEECGLPLMTYNSSERSPDKCIKDILDYLNKERK